MIKAKSGKAGLVLILSIMILFGLILKLFVRDVYDLLDHYFDFSSREDTLTSVPIGGTKIFTLFGYVLLEGIFLTLSLFFMLKNNKKILVYFVAFAFAFLIQYVYAQYGFYANYKIVNRFFIAMIVVNLTVLVLLYNYSRQNGIKFTKIEFIKIAAAALVVLFLFYTIEHISM